MSSKSTNLRNSCTANRIRTLALLLSVGGAIAVLDGLIFGPQKPIRGIVTFLSGVSTILVRVYLWRTSNLRIATFAASATTGVVFLSNYVLFGDPYYMAVGFSVPIAASLFLNARDAAWVVGIFSFLGIVIAFALQNGLVEPQYSPETLMNRTIVVIAIIASMAGPTMLMQHLFSRSVDREYQMRSRFETICDYGFGAMFELNSSGRIAFARGRLINELGFQVDDLLGHRPIQHVFREDRRRMFESVAFDSGNHCIEDELRIVDANGEERWVRISGGTANNVPGVDAVYALQDIHEQFVHRQRVQEFSRIESLGNLSAGLAHDFNNLLTVIGITAAGVKNERQREEILRAQRQAADLTSGLLAFARKQPFRQRDVCLVELLESSRPLLQKLIPPNVTCRWNMGCDAAPVRLDASQFEQVLINLITNAKQAMPQGGSLSINLERITLSEDEAFAHETQPGRFARLTVTDSGCGMDKRVVSRSIEPFFTTKSRGVGTGLGLAMAHGTMLRCEGALVIESQPEVGTEIALLVPLQSGTVKDSTIELITDLAPSPASYAVVLVEDHPIVAASVKEMLESLGHSVQLFYDAESATEVLSNDLGVDILISDVVLPGMSGIELAKQTMEWNSNIKSILISAYLTQELEALTGSLGSVEILSKPFTSEQLQSKMAEVTQSNQRAA